MRQVLQLNFYLKIDESSPVKLMASGSLCFSTPAVEKRANFSQWLHYRAISQYWNPLSVGILGLKIAQKIEFIDLTARMALRADASQFWLGYLWWILEPLLFVAVFYLVFGVILESPRADFLSFLIVGKLPFQWFSGGVNSSVNSIYGAQHLIAQAPVPKSLLVLSRVQQVSYKQAAVFLLLLIYVLADGAKLNAAWFLLPLVILTQYVMVASCALIGAVLGCYAQDFAKLIQFAILALMFVSGIFWDVRSLSTDMQWWLLTFNPLAFLLDAYRQIMLYGQSADVFHLISILGFFSGLALLTMKWIGRNETELTARVLS